ncbi:MAG TPA: GNAT family N-acetyltransferase [Oscillatoriaceae cyanobacterium]
MLRILPVEKPEHWQAAQAIRMAVFVAEQGVPAEEEMDAYDAEARHWLVLSDDTPIGTARALEKAGAWKIGRVAVLAAHRGSGVGAELMRAIIAEAEQLGVPELMLDSQTHALGFYERLGFCAEGPEFLDAGIPHRRMRRASRR